MYIVHVPPSPGVLLPSSLTFLHVYPPLCLPLTSSLSFPTLFFFFLHLLFSFLFPLSPSSPFSLLLSISLSLLPFPFSLPSLILQLLFFPLISTHLSSLPFLLFSVSHSSLSSPSLLPTSLLFSLPQEYGITEIEKLDIATKICSPLLRKIQSDLQHTIVNGEADIIYRLNPRLSKGVVTPNRHVRTRLYFTSESHVHSMLNILRYGNLVDVRACTIQASFPGHSSQFTIGLGMRLVPLDIVSW